MRSGRSPQKVFLDFAEVDSRGLALLPTLELVAQLLTFVELTETRALDRGNVNENILGAVIRLDESIALLWVVPFDRTGRHVVRSAMSFRYRPRLMRMTDRTSTQVGEQDRPPVEGGRATRQTRADKHINRRKVPIWQIPPRARATSREPKGSRGVGAAVVVITQ